MYLIPTADDDDADWLLVGAKAEPTNWRGRNSLKARPESTCQHRVKSVGPGTRMILKPGTGPAVSVLAGEKNHRASNWAKRRVYGSKIRLS